MHLSLFGLPSSKQSSATPDARFTKPQSHFQRTMADRATKRQQRRQQLKESLENNSQAVNKIMETSAQELPRSHTEPTMNAKWSKMKEETMRRVSTASGALGSLKSEFVIKNSKKKS